ncbi:hypothetical protein GGS21DRAFT_161506 [Xylaria nigripes]|nr:hypothetical protein GGS21DRAFT_161506 [Xylaria nigripes]
MVNGIDDARRHLIVAINHTVAFHGSLLIVTFWSGSTSVDATEEFVKTKWFPAVSHEAEVMIETAGFMSGLAIFFGADDPKRRGVMNEDTDTFHLGAKSFSFVQLWDHQSFMPLNELRSCMLSLPKESRIRYPVSIASNMRFIAP